MIRSFRIQDFKAHRDTTIPLRRFTLLVGPNGSGKTSVLEALKLQSELAFKDQAEVFRGDQAISDLRRRGASGAIVITAGEIAYDPRVEDDAKKGRRSRLEVTDPSGHAMVRWTGTGAGDRTFNISGPALKFDEHCPIGPAQSYKLIAGRIARAAYRDSPSTQVDPDGSCTATALAQIKLAHDEVFARIEGDLKKIVASVERVRLKQHSVLRSVTRGKLAEFDNVTGFKIYFDFVGAPDVPAQHASEGTLIALALLTILHEPTRPRIVLLDDFDQSLHPLAQMELVRLVRALLEEIPDVQIVATTHSPYVLDAIGDPDSVMAFALRKDGTVAVKPLSQHPDVEKTKGALTLGQLWSLDKEQAWVLSPDER